MKVAPTTTTNTTFCMVYIYYFFRNTEKKPPYVKVRASYLLHTKSIADELIQD